jgi:NADPH:quinone reductase-like Zn-dependent oxidoreductase
MTDCLIRQGLWWGSTSSPLPNIPGADVVGKLHRIDEDSSKKFNLLKGDRVLSLVKWGGNSRYLPVDPSKLVKLPEMIDPAAATTLAETYLGAFQTLHHGQGNGLRYRETSLKGRNILVLGNACSNMGRAIVQLASAASADQVYALAKPKHFPHVLELGMTPLNKGSLEWWDLLNGRIDILISLGEDVQSLHCKALKSSGRAFVLSNNKKLHDSRKQKLGRPKDIISFRKKSKKVEFYDVYEEWDMNIERCKSDLRHLVSLLEHRKITPHILDRIPLHKVARAHVLMESKHLSGFIVCEPWLVAKTRAIRL